MCKLLADLASADKQVVKEMIHRLEHASGLPGVDVRLTGEIYGKLHMKMRELGLDPNDTTPHELYTSLQNLARLHDSFLARRLAIEEPTNPAVVLPAVVHVVNRLQVPKQVWAIKPVVIKRLLKTVPPKTLMKQLHYRSLDSMLKRESTASLLTAARHLEPELWQRKMLDAYKKLQSGDFSSEQAEITYKGEARWQKIGEWLAHERHSSIVYTPEAGSILVLPLPKVELPGLTLAVLMLVVHALEELRMHSTYFKFHHMQPKFGTFLSRSLTEETADHARLAGQPIHWRIVHRYYGGKSVFEHPEIFQPHIQPEDIAYRKAEAILYRLEPALHFWHDLDYVGLPQPIRGPVSFSLMDNAIGLLNKLPYERRVNYHLRDAVWNELYSRYVGQQALERQLMQQLDEQFLGNALMPNDMEFAW